MAAYDRVAVLLSTAFVPKKPPTGVPANYITERELSIVTPTKAAHSVVITRQSESFECVQNCVVHLRNVRWVRVMNGSCAPVKSASAASNCHPAPTISSVGCRICDGGVLDSIFLGELVHVQRFALGTESTKAQQ